MTNGANYKRGKLHHSPWHSDIHTSNQLNRAVTMSSLESDFYMVNRFGLDMQGLKVTGSTCIDF